MRSGGKRGYVPGNIREHGGGLDAAAKRFGGDRADWIDLSTGINPQPYPVPRLSPDSWTALPDKRAQERLIEAARQFWNVPPDAALLAVPGASAAIAQIPRLTPRARVSIAQPTYNEHGASFAAHGWTEVPESEQAEAAVIVHPNNPDGRTFDASALAAPLMIVDESFCDVMPSASLMPHATRPGLLILKSFGKFWGLAGLRLGFVVGDPALIARLADMLGPWPVSGPALEIGTTALRDTAWAEATHQRLRADAARLDQLVKKAGLQLAGGTDLFRLYETPDAALWQERLARHRIWSRSFSYATQWLRLGLPPADGWARLEQALA